MAKEIICYGEMLFDLLPSGNMPGGAPMNVAIHLAMVGCSSAIISRVGQDELGKELIAFLQGKDVNTRFVQQDTTQPTGVVNVDASDPSEITYDIIAPAAWDFIQLEEEAKLAVEQCQAFVYGTLAARDGVSRHTLLHFLDLAPYRVLDVNFRSPFYIQESAEELLHLAHLAKMNHHELAEISNWYHFGLPVKESMMILCRKFKLEVLVVTRGANGAIVLHDNTFTEHPGFPVEVEDTIGSGDAFLATFLSQFLAGFSVADSLEKACLVGALVATQRGATPLITPQEIANFEAVQSQG